MLDEALFFDRPYRHFLCLDSFDEALTSEAKRVLGGAIPWETRVGTFYVTYRLDLRAHFEGREPPWFVRDEVLLAMRDRMMSLFSVPLSDDIQVLGHKMVPGQSIGVHNDNPGLGFEGYRIVLQLTDAHRPEDGGLLRIHSSDKEAEVYQHIRPCFNMSFGFEMCARSYHSVTTVANRDRDALIFNFWHLGNTPAVERAIVAATRDLGLLEGDPPGGDEGDPLAQASTCALLLRRWGAAEQAMAAGFLTTLRDLPAGASAQARDGQARRMAALLDLPLSVDPGEPAEAPWQRADLAERAAAMSGADPATLSAIVTLAAWVARARKRIFYPQLWERARALVAPCAERLPPEARSLAGALFPGGACPEADRGQRASSLASIEP